MRAFALITLFGLFVSACSPGNPVEREGVNDDRYDLVQLNMPPILVSDAKRCTLTSRGWSEVPDDESEVIKIASGLARDFWSYADQNFELDDKRQGVLPYGAGVDGVESIFPKGIKLPDAVAHACGEYAGQVIVSVGVLSISDSLEMAMELNPEVFTELGMDADEVMAGLASVKSTAAGMEEVSPEDRIHCVAIYQAAKINDESLQPFLRVWMTSFVNAIEAGDIEPTKIQERSKFWNLLALRGPDAVLSADEYEDQALKCEAWVNESIAKQAAK